MTTHVDVVAELDNRSIMVSANDLKGGLERIGDDAGRGFGAAFGRGTSTASAGLDGMRGRIVAVTNQAISLGGHLADVDRTAVGLGQKGVTAFGGMGTSALAASVGVAAVGTAALVVGKQLYDLGAEWDNIADGITVRTGRVGDQLSALTDIVGDVGSATAASLGSIGEIVGQLSQSMPGLTENGTAIRQMASNLAYLDANGQAVNIRELGKAFSAFGVGAADQVKTLDELNNVSQATGLPINQLIGSVQSGAAQFKQFGLDIGGATSLIASFEDAGLDSGVTVTGLRTALKNLGDDARGAGPALTDAVTQIKKLHDTGQEGGALKLAQDTFGVKNFAPFLDAIENGRIGVEGLDKAFGDLGMTIADQQKATDDGAQGWQKLVNTIKTEAGPAASGFFSFLNDEVRYLTGNLTDAADKLKDVAAVPIDPKSALGQLLTTGGLAIPGAAGPAAGVTRPTGIGTFTTPGSDGGLRLPNGTMAPNWGTHQVAAPSGAAAGAAKTPGAPGVPFDTSLPPGFAQLPQTAELYSAESSFLDARHGTAEKQAKLNQLLHDNTATEDQIVNARVDVAQAQRSQTEAEMRLYDTQNKQLKNQTGQLNQIGAQLDSDFGISKGLAGIAENITKFVANLAVAPWEAQMNAIANAPGQAQGGFGLMGMLGAQGAFGQQFTAAGQAAGASSGASSLGPAGLMPGGGYPSDAAVLGNVPAGSYSQAGNADLTKGLGDCSSAVEDLVNIMDGRPTGGRAMSTGNAAEWLTQHGFQPGMGGPGDMRVGYDAGHMQATLPGGTPFNWGSDAAAARGGVGGTGADDSAFTSHYYRPMGAWSPGASGVAGGLTAGSSGGVVSVFVTNMGAMGNGGAPIDAPTPGGPTGAPSTPPSPAPFTPTPTTIDNNTYGPDNPWTPSKSPGSNPYAPAPASPGFSSGDVTNPSLTNPPAPGASPGWFPPGAGMPTAGPGGGGMMPGTGMPRGMPPSPGGPGVGPTQIGGGDGLSGSGKGGIGASDSTMALAGMAASALDVMAPGAGQAAQTAMKLANRAIQYGGQVAGIGAQGVIDTVLPFGGSQLASNSWATKLIGGIAGAAPALPNMAGKAAAAPAPGQGGQQGGQPGKGGDTNISVTNNRATEDGTGRDIAYHQQEMNSMPGKP